MAPLITLRLIPGIGLLWLLLINGPCGHAVETRPITGASPRQAAAPAANLLSPLTAANTYGGDLAGTVITSSPTQLIITAPADAPRHYSVGASFPLIRPIENRQRYVLTVPIEVARQADHQLDITIAIVRQQPDKTYEDVWLRNELLRQTQVLRYHFTAETALSATTTVVAVHCARRAQTVIIGQPELLEYTGKKIATPFILRTR